MRKRKKALVGLDWDGKIVWEKDFGFIEIAVVAEGMRALGTKIRLENDACPYDYRNVMANPSRRRLNVVVGDPRLLSNVRVVMRGWADSLPDIPAKVKYALSRSGYIIVFENEHGERIYAREKFTTLLSTVKHLIVYKISQRNREVPARRDSFLIYLNTST